MEKSNANKAADANRYSPNKASFDANENRDNDATASTNPPHIIRSNHSPSTWTKRLHCDFILAEN